MKLYDLTIGPNPRRVRMFMAEKGIEVEKVQINTRAGENLSKEFLAKNRFGKVPVLELDDGTCISESVAICRYLEETQPEPSLFGRTTMEKTMIEMWQRQVEIYLTLVVSAAFRNLTALYKDRETIVKEWGEASLERAKTVYGMLDEHLADSRYFAGEAFSIADITAICTIDFAKLIELDIEADQKNLARWYEAVSSRPSAQA